VPWYREHRDLLAPAYAEVEFYASLPELDRQFGEAIAAADAVIVGSYVPEGPGVIDLVTRRTRGALAFYDIDTPITMEALDRGHDAEYLRADQIARFDVYLSFTGGPTLEILEERYGAQKARALYCAVDPTCYRPVEGGGARLWDLGYLGTYSEDRAEGLERRLLGAARSWPEGRFIVAGAQFPPLAWPPNVERREHVAPSAHAAFYAAQRFTLNLTRAAMCRAGYSPSIRLFEAAACGVPVISDCWPGLETFFEPGREILVTSDTSDTLDCLCNLTEVERQRIGEQARQRVLSAHTSAHRAAELESYLGMDRTAIVAEVGPSLGSARGRGVD
jgi:spore maturation protein CgeB